MLAEATKQIDSRALVAQATRIDIASPSPSKQKVMSRLYASRKKDALYLSKIDESRGEENNRTVLKSPTTAVEVYHKQLAEKNDIIARYESQNKEFIQELKLVQEDRDRLSLKL